MIGIEGQYLFIFSIGGKDDFLDSKSLTNFVITEESGNSLPTWKIEFTTEDPELLLVFNEGNDFEVSFGQTLEKLKSTKLLITKRILSGEGAQKLYVVALGVYSAMDYIINPVKQISDKKSGIEILVDTVSKHFKVDTNVNSSEDSQNWIQPNIPNSVFVDNLWLHSYIANSFIGTAITFEGEFIIRDIKALVQEDYKFRFTNKVEEDNDISYSGDYYLESEAGFINCWVGYGKKKLIHSLEDGSQSTDSETIKPLLALTKNLNRRSGIKDKATISGMHNENTHSNYWQAALRNVMGLSIFSSEKNTLSFSNNLVDIHPYDLVMFKDEDIVSANQSSEFQSGLYLVGAVGMSVSNNDLVITIDLYREAFNAIEGELS